MSVSLQIQFHKGIDFIKDHGYNKKSFIKCQKWFWIGSNNMCKPLGIIGVNQSDSPFGAQYNHSLHAPSFRFHHHASYEFYIFLRGEVKICIENLIYDVKPNTLFIYPPNSLHGLLCQDEHSEYERMYFHVHPEFLDHFAMDGFSMRKKVEKACYERNLLYSLTDEQVELLYSIITRIDELSRERVTPLRELKRSHLLGEAILQIADVMDKQEYTGMHVPYQKHPFLSTVLAYISDHFTETLTLDLIADHVSVSKYHLSHEFKRLTNNSIMSFIILKRLQYALQLLKSGLSPTETCFRSGFSSYSNFQKAFQSYYGVTPGRFRQISANWSSENTSH